MKARISAALMITGVVLASCTTQPTPTYPFASARVYEAPAKPPFDGALEAEYRQIVIDYVQETRGWSSDSYTVQYNDTENNFVLFVVTYLPAARKMGLQKKGAYKIGNDGESFVAYVDPVKKKVEKALYFQ